MCETKIEISLDERIFNCPNCGYSEDRDIHAAKNIKKIGSLKRAEWSERPSVEFKTSANSDFNIKELSLSL
jgi:putative transposase